MPYFGGNSGSGYFGSGGSSGYFGGSKKTKKHSSAAAAPFHFAGNFLGDVKDSVTGFFPGMVQLAKHPIKSVEDMANMTWHTWSPLFHGDFVKFGKGVYDHPLAPLLDVATVFSLGLDAATLGAATPLTGALLGARTAEKLTTLRAPRSVSLIAPEARDVKSVARAGGNKIVVANVKKGQLPHIVQDAAEVPRGLGRHPVPFVMSQRPMRRLFQEARLKGVEPHLPSWYKDARYERRWRSEMTHRERAKNQRIANSLQYVAVLKAGEALSDPEAWGAARSAITSNMVQGLEAHAPSFAHPGAKKPPKGYRFLAPEQDVVKYVQKIDTPEEFEKFLANAQEGTGFAKVATTSSAKRAVRKADGSMPLVPIAGAWRLGREAARSSTMVRLLWHHPTTAWKAIQVGWTPRTVTNNGVGNWLLYGARLNPSQAIAGMYDAIRYTKGERAARRLGTPEALGSTDSLWYNKHHLDELNDTFGAELLGQEALGIVPGKMGRAQRVARSGFYPIVHKTSDRPVRLAALSAFYRKNPEVQRLMKDKRMTFDQAVEAAIAQNPELRVQASGFTRTIAGDYTTLTDAGRVVRDLMPFYLWNRHILKTTGNMAMETPARLVAVQRISNMGEATVEEILGAVPEWLKGAIPLSMIGLAKDSDRAKVLTTQSLNPFATVGDLALMTQALTVGDTSRPASEVLGQMNPFLQGTIESLTGESLLTGAPKPKYGGALPTLAANTFLAFPQVKLGQELMTPDTETTPQGNPYLYARDDLTSITSIFGIPIKSVDLMRAHSLAQSG